MNFIKILIIIIFIFSCDKKEILYKNEYFPELEEDIPYDELGHGKILFERISPYPGKYDFLCIIDIDNKVYYPIKIFDIYCYDFALSPDGEKIIFQNGYNIFIMNNDGTGLKYLTKSYGYFAPVWGRNSNNIYFFKEGVLYSFNINNTEDVKEYVTNFAYYDELGNFSGYLCPFSRVSVSSKNEILFSINIKDKKGVYLLEDNHYKINLLYSSDKINMFFSPKFSPIDDNKIAFKGVMLDSNRRYDSVFVFFMDIKNNYTKIIFKYKSQCSRIWVDFNWSEYLYFSPNGEKIIFNINEDDFISHIYMINVNDWSVIQLTKKEGVTDRNISWGR